MKSAAKVDYVPESAAQPDLTRPPTPEERRRAQRVLLRIPVQVHFPGKTQSVPGMTHTVSENGAMIVVPDPLSEGTKVTIENPATRQRVDVRVVRPLQITSEGSLVPVEFLAAAPAFWNIIFPPAIN